MPAVPAPADSASPVVLLFLKAPRVGQVKTRLARDLGPERAAAVYRRLVERQVRQLPVGWSVEIHFAPDDAGDAMRAWLGPVGMFRAQAAGDLGARLAAGFAQAFAAGAAKVVAIGGDCPELGAVDFDAAADALARHDVVIGPAADGGYYLLGLRRPAPALFADMPWSTPEVGALTLTRAAAAGLSCHCLSTKADIDDLSALRDFVSRVPPGAERDEWAGLSVAGVP